MVTDINFILEKLESLNSNQLREVIAKSKILIGPINETVSCNCSDIITENENSNIDIKILSFGELTPSIKFIPLNESQEDVNNIWYVDDYQVIPNSCGTGAITFKESVFYMNMCEQNGVASIDLLVETPDKTVKNINFILKKDCNAENNHDMIIHL